MTGYDAGDPAARTPSGEPADDESVTGRPGPRPPRMDLPTGAIGGRPAGFTGQTGGFPAHRAPTSFPPGQVSSGPAGHISSGPAGPISSGPMNSATGAFPPAFAAPPPPPRRGILAPIAMVLTVLLLGVVVLQTFFLMDLNDKYDKLRADAQTQRTAAEERNNALEERTKELERRAGNTLDTQAVAGTVLPSVFRVTSSVGIGTGFAFGKEPPEGGSYVITNYHVIDRVWTSGQRQVTLEQQNRRFTATIVKVDEGADLALLTSPDKFPTLQSAAEPAKPGLPVVVVGSPLGLEDSVTSGVVSALRTTAAGPVLQFDAPVNPGNSGGPVVNAQGQVVGVVNAKLNNAEGISLGIPVAVVCETLGIC
jgi:S1-C subfamily serine protease